MSGIFIGGVRIRTGKARSICLTSRDGPVKMQSVSGKIHAAFINELRPAATTRSHFFVLSNSSTFVRNSPPGAISRWRSLQNSSKESSRFLANLGWSMRTAETNGQCRINYRGDAFSTVFAALSMFPEPPVAPGALSGRNWCSDSCFCTAWARLCPRQKLPLFVAPTFCPRNQKKWSETHARQSGNILILQC